MARRFYLGSSLVFLALVFLAFIKSYYLKFLFDTPALSTLVHVHGVVMSGWVALLVVQSGLVAAHRVQWHRRLGVFGTGWAALVAAAVWLRRRTDYHKRLMFLTIICLLPSAVARLPIGMQSNQVILLYVDLFLLVCVAMDTIRHRRLHPAFGWGASLVLLALNAAFLASQTPWWISLGSRLVS